VVGVDELTAEIRSALLRLVAEVCLREHDTCQRLGLGGTDVRFLTLLDIYGPLTPGRLATLTGLTTGSVTGVIDRLERAGYVSRRRDEADRRKVRVVPVPEAVARLAAERRDILDLLEAVLARRNRDELVVIAGFVDEIVERYDEGRAARDRTDPGRAVDGQLGRGPRRGADRPGHGPR
jgi:DNA-binding MarR family transcriptional regulator